MNAEMIGHLSLSIIVFLNRLLNPLVPPTGEVIERSGEFYSQQPSDE